MKKIIFWFVLVGMTALFAEAGAAFVLFHSGSLRSMQVYIIDYSDGSSALVQLGKKVLRRASLLQHGGALHTVSVSSDPSPLYIYDETLGYTIAPGLYRVSLTNLREEPPDLYKFWATVEPNGSRATSHVPHCAKRTVWVFGDSVVWGWGNNDEQTFPWLLQARYPHTRFINNAQNGYGTIHALVQLRSLAGRIDADDLIIVGYQSYLNRRNVASPSRLRAIDTARWSVHDAERARHPYGVLEDGRLRIEFVGLSCANNYGWCDQPDPPEDEMAAVTKAIFAEIRALTDATLIVAYMEGDDDDPVIAFLREQNVPVADARPNARVYQVDDFEPFDSHPGPLAQYHYHRKIAQFLEENDYLDRSAAGSAATGLRAAGEPRPPCDVDAGAYR